MAAVSRFQVGFKKEVTWGTPVTVDRFAEFNTEGVLPKHGRVVSSGLRSGHRVRRKDRQVPYVRGGMGPVQFDVLASGFGFWLEHMVGTIAAPVGPTDSKYTHSATFGALKGLGFTFQNNRPLNPPDSDQAFTFEGGKVAKWKLSNKAAGALVCDLDLDFENYSTATALASASYPSAAEPLTFVGAAITIGGSSFDVVKNIEISCDNKLRGTTDTDDQRYLRSSPQHTEPVEGDFRDVTWTIEAEFDALTQFNRFASAAASGLTAAIVATWTGLVLIGSSSVATLQVTVHDASFDDFEQTVAGPQPLQQKLSGVGLYDGSNSPVTIVYGTSDATP